MLSTYTVSKYCMVHLKSFLYIKYDGRTRIANTFVKQKHKSWMYHKAGVCKETILHALTQLASMAVSNDKVKLFWVLHSSTQRTYAANSVLAQHELVTSEQWCWDSQQFCSLVDASAVRQSHLETRRVSILRPDMKS